MSSSGILNESEELEHRINTLVEAMERDPAAIDTNIRTLFSIIKESTSDPSSIPVAVRYTKDHLDTLTSLYTLSEGSEAGRVFADILALMITMFPREGEDNDEATAKYLLAGTDAALHVWGSEFMRNVAMILARKYSKNLAADDAAANEPLLPLLVEAIQTHKKHVAEPEMLDLLLETGLLDSMIDSLLEKPDVTDEKNSSHSRVCEYLVQTAQYSSEERFSELLRIVYRLKRSAGFLADALRVALWLNEDVDLVNDVFAAPECEEPGVRLQLALVLAQHGPYSLFLLRDLATQLPDARHRAIACGLWRRRFFREFVSGQDLEDPLLPEDAFRIETLPVRSQSITPKHGSLAAALTNGLLNAGFEKDALIAGDGRDEWVLTLSSNDFVRLSVSASTGLLHLFAGASGGLNVIDAYSRSTCPHIRSGSLLASALTLVGRAEAGGLDVALCMFGEKVNQFFYYPERKPIVDFLVEGNAPEFFRLDSAASEDAASTPRASEEMTVQPDLGAYQTPIRFANNSDLPPRYDITCAALGLGLVYACTGNLFVRALLMDRIITCSYVRSGQIPPLDKTPRHYTAIALGMVMAGSADAAAADCILRLVAGHSTNQRSLKLFYFSTFGLGLIFLGRLDAAKAYAETVLAKFESIAAPDSTREVTGLPSRSQQLRLAAFIQALVIALGGAGCGDVSHFQSLLTGITEATAGRRAAEEHAMRVAEARKAGEDVTGEGDAQLGGQGRRSRKQKRPNRAQRNIASLLGTRERTKSAERVEEDLLRSVQTPFEAVQLPDEEKTEVWCSSTLDPVYPLVLGLGLASGPDPLTRQMLQRIVDRIIQFGTPQARRAAPLALALTSLSNPDVAVGDTLFHLSHDKDETTAMNATLALGLVGAGTKNSRIAGRLRTLFGINQKSGPAVFATKLALGFVYMGKGTLALTTHHSHGRVPCQRALVGLVTFFLSMAPSWKPFLTTAGVLSFFTLAPAIAPRFCHTVDAEGNSLPVKAAIGTWTDTVGLAAQGGARLSGFQTCETPVGVAAGGSQRVEIIDKEYYPLTSVMEDVVVLRHAAPGADRDALD
eukprot:gnl/Chilomastix_cuspidata/271.p1 GENE.gnl/Chilomastix_cuspidata/271~~gnl/Chilomastix_cuspidata/271.p1  ORF type:complete len:1067 (+),score=486.09 gnl/Chilomastix_cuspidata/271:4320-7520(+)